LIARNIGNTSVELYWDPPQFSNGVLLFYKVWANGKDHKVSDRDDTVEIDNGHITRMNYTLKGLMAYTDYDIAVEACTKECSTPMKTKIKTTVGLPGDFRRQPKIQTFRNNLMNKTTGNLEWEEPVFRGGELDYYEFKRTLKQSDGSLKDHIVKTRKMKCYVDNLCASNTIMEEFSVRAVNFVLTPHSKVSRPEIRGSDDDQSCDKDDYELLNSLKALKLADPHSWYLPGPWSPPVSHSCSPQHATTLQVFMLMATMVASLLIIGMVYFSYKKIKDMKDILVQMPPGLEDLTGDKLKKAKDLNAHMDKMGTPDILRNVDNMSINCEDENGQLLKKSLNGSLHGGDCSSSMHSDSTRSEMDHENDEIEYGEFGQDNRKGKRVNDGLQVNFVVAKDV
jgi:Fibronectin type III domain